MCASELALSLNTKIASNTVEQLNKTPVYTERNELGLFHNWNSSGALFFQMEYAAAWKFLHLKKKP